MNKNNFFYNPIPAFIFIPNLDCESHRELSQNDRPKKPKNSIINLK